VQRHDRESVDRICKRQQADWVKSDKIAGRGEEFEQVSKDSWRMDPRRQVCCIQPGIRLISTICSFGQPCDHIVFSKFIREIGFFVEHTDM
jgi:hypothetical protein